MLHRNSMYLPRYYMCTHLSWYFILAITRVGNWNEDLFLAAEIEKDFERRKANGELKHQKLEKIRTQFLSPVNTSPHGDKVVSMGDIVMLKNLHLSHSIAVFSDNQIHYSVTGSNESIFLVKA